MNGERLEKLEKFNTSRQETVRLAIALEEFFRADLQSDARNVYEAYLKRRLRPAVAELIEQEDLSRLEHFRHLGWLTIQQVSDGILHARRERRTASLIWLLGIMDQDFGFHDRDFSL